MTWTNILVPVLGGDQDERLLSIAKAAAEPFGATVTMAFASMPPSSLFDWVNEAGVGPTEIAMAALQQSADSHQARCRERLAALDYSKKAFEAVHADDWIGLRTVSRLADAVVWDRSVARGHGAFAGAFQQILLDERRPALIAERSLAVGGTAVVAWDGGREASRAIRRAIPLLQKADKVVVLTAPHAMARPCDAARAIDYLGGHGVTARAEVLPALGEAGELILEAAALLDARVLIAGAYGHPRLQRFIFGGTTQTLVDRPLSAALFLSH